MDGRILDKTIDTFMNDLSNKPLRILSRVLLAIFLMICISFDLPRVNHHVTFIGTVLLTIVMYIKITVNEGDVIYVFRSNFPKGYDIIMYTLDK